MQFTNAMDIKYASDFVGKHLVTTKRQFDTYIKHFAYMVYECRLLPTHNNKKKVLTREKKVALNQVFICSNANSSI